MDHFFEKLPFPSWRTSVSQRIEMYINSFLSLKKSWKMMWWSIARQRIQNYFRKFSQLQSLKINNGEIEFQQISKITNVEKHRNIRKQRAIERFCEISESYLKLSQYKSK